MTKSVTVVEDRDIDWDEDYLSSGSTPRIPSPSMVPESHVVETDLVGITGGTFSVSETGAALYSIPLAVAPGTAGVAPSLSISYSSQAGDGLFGKHWSLSGLSGISRCRQTLMQDRRALPITWGASDRFCLNGQRLLLESGVYGNPGSVYRTEVDSYVKVVAVGGTAGNPDYFRLESKDGSVTYFGETWTQRYGTLNAKTFGYSNASTVQSDRVLSWNISRFEDNMENAIVYRYAQTATYHRLESIRYAFGATSTPAARIEFAYETRPDPSVAYVAGSRFRNTVRISSIRTYGLDSAGSEQMLRLYEMNYGYEDRPELLAKVTECSSVYRCLDPIEFEWGQSETAEYSGLQRTVANNAKVVSHVLLDIDGDGVQDLAWVERNGDTQTLYYVIHGVNNPLQTIQLARWTSGAEDVHLRAIDYNLDGHDDLVVYNPNLQGTSSSPRWRLYTAQPNSATWRLAPGPALPFASLEEDIKFADFNSNGITDAYYINSRDRRIQVYEGIVRSDYVPGDANPYHFAATPKAYQLPSDGNDDSDIESGRIELADINGNGRADVVALLVRRRCQSETLSWGCYRRRSVVVYEAVDNGFRFLAKLYEGGKDEAIDALQVIDINGDGLAEVAYLAGGQWRYHVNMGGEFRPAQVINVAHANTARAGFADLNGNGYLDFYWQENQGSYRKIYWQPEIERYFGASVIFGDNHGDDLTVADISGNGVPDLLFTRGDRSRNSSESGVRAMFSDATSQNAPLYMTKIKTAHGASTDILYNNLSSSGHYSGYPVNPWSNTREFYHAVHHPFSDLPSGSDMLMSQQRTDAGSFSGMTPVQGLRGAIPIVATVHSSAPTRENPSATSGIAYYYHRGLIQAAGRGMLGFKSLKTRDLQTNVETTTTYRQDWPFVGMPVSTVVKAPQQVISESRNEYRLLDFDSRVWSDRLERLGSQSLGPLRVYAASKVDLSYELNANAQLPGSPIQKTITKQEIDRYGNVTHLDIEIQDRLRGQTYRTTTDNQYGGAVWMQELGRLTSSEVVTVRPDYAFQTQVRHVEYEYYSQQPHRGMLYSETVKEGDTDYGIETRHFYDQFGNTVFTSTQGQKDGSARISALKIYDSRGRFVDRTYGVFNGLLGSNAPGVTNAYTNELARLRLAGQVSVQRTSQVIERDAYGTPTEVRHFTGADSNNATFAATSPFGVAYMTYNNTGSYTVDTAYRGYGQHCPLALTAFHTQSRSAGGRESIACFDLLGRPIRQADKSFDGSWVYTDTEYNVLGQVVRVSEPGFGATSLWTRFEYDIFGRQILAVAPDGGRQETRFRATQRGHEIVSVNAKGQESTTVNDALGNRILSVDAVGGEIDYQYHVNGQLFYTRSRLEASESGGAIRAVMLYDLWGRKIRMFDVDKGTWDYRYNAIGELICQSDAEGNTIENRYDGAGRIIERLERRSGNCANLSGTLVGRTFWEYDTAAYGLGKLTDEQDEFTGYRKLYFYDNFGRLQNKNSIAPRTSNGMLLHAQNLQYDQFGRLWKNIEFLIGTNFPGGNRQLLQGGTQNVFNAHGYLARVVDPHEPRNEYYRTTRVDARGNVTGVSIGGGIVNSEAIYHPVTGMLEQLRATNGSATRLQDLSMRWDIIGNLDHRIDKGVNSNGAYRNLREDFAYDNLNRLESYAVTGRQPVTVRYDGRGNITSKTGVGSYMYEHSRSPHAVTKAGNVTYNYDHNGNVISDSNGRVLRYTAYNLIERATKGGRSTEFQYAPDRSRLKRVDTNTNNRTTTTFYFGNIEYVSHEDGSDEAREYIGGTVMRTNRFTTAGSMATQVQYLLKDHLGSLNAIVNANGTLQQAMAFDPWGKRRNPSNWQELVTSSSSNPWFVSAKPSSSRGFTGHQMVDEMEFIHMNGRIYDPTLARFLQADPFVQAPSISASLNRYSYVWNNPLNATDPSGFIMRDFKRTFRSAIRSTGDFIGSKTVTNMLGNAASTFCGPGAPACAAAWNYEFARAHGASSSQAFTSGAISGVTAYLSTAIGDAYGNPSFLSGDHLTKVALHGMLGGTAAYLQGGKFGHGFIAAGTMEFAAPGIGQIAPGSTGAFSRGFVLRTSVAAIVGGTASELTNGKFKNGAATAAFQWMYNHEESLLELFSPGPPDDITAEEYEQLRKLPRHNVDRTDASVFPSSKNCTFVQVCMIRIDEINDSLSRGASNDAILEGPRNESLRRNAIKSFKSFFLKEITKGALCTAMTSCELNNHQVWPRRDLVNLITEGL